MGDVLLVQPIFRSLHKHPYSETMLSESCIHSRSQEAPHLLFLAGVFVSDHALFTPLPHHGERDASNASVYFCLSVFWLLLRLNRSLSNLLMSCKATCLPPTTGRLEWERDSRDFLTGQCLSGQKVDTVYKPRSCQIHTLPPPQGDQGCSFETHTGIVWYTLATLRKLRCQE